MDVEKLKKSMEGRGWSFKFFKTGAQAAEYLTGRDGQLDRLLAIIRTRNGR